MVAFKVNVISFNAENFAANYAPYIKGSEEGWFGNVVYDMAAPVDVYEEIGELSEEFIDIVS